MPKNDFHAKEVKSTITCFPHRWFVLLGNLPCHLLIFFVLHQHVHVGMSYMYFHINPSTSALYDILGWHQDFFLIIPTKQRQRQTLDVDELIDYQQMIRHRMIGFRSNLYPLTSTILDELRHPFKDPS